MEGGGPDVIVCMITGGGSDVNLEKLIESNYDVDLFILDFDPSPEVLPGGANIQVPPRPAAIALIAAAAATAHPDPQGVPLPLAAQVIANWADDTVVVVPNRNNAADLGVTLDSMRWTFDDDGYLKSMSSSDAVARVNQVSDRLPCRNRARVTPSLPGFTH